MADLTRIEQFLNHIAHPEDPIPAPLTRMEQSLIEIAENKDEAALPPVSAEDNGDVLTVVDGAWAKAAPSGGGGGAFVVNMDAQNTLDKTWQEIYDAATSGQVVTVIRQISAEGQMVYNIMPVLIVASGEGVYYVSAIAFTQGASQVNFAATSADGYPEMVGS